MSDATPPAEPKAPPTPPAARQDGSTEPMTPPEIEAELDRLRNEIARFVLIVAWAERLAIEAKTAYEVAHAKVAYHHNGTPTESKWAAEIDPTVVDLRNKWDAAEATAKLQRGHEKALDKALSSVQAMNRSVIAHYTSETGRGR